ncbi:very short patch repair endonuclease [Chelativorans sp. SCAU2101]|uniref:Very short patch repair endonuclease n=1 Tax=Chelativorans petroleitrophicus TaxID=2975484 RepID=A0A9X3B8Z5_9HYPH|nr:very short patch repair endonuclease [Chelativorans petroleitrophicus]MCT8989631.1 very short patch repair endonuclease [Chelativorans petroleitrophicus]
MPDIVSPEVRSQIMARIRGANTKPEMILRRGLHALGFRFRLHSRHLPGRPDIVFPRFRAVLFVHGCFWHGHDCHLHRLPTTRQDFWAAKIEANRCRDARVSEAIGALGWRQGIVWECSMRGRSRLDLEDIIVRCAAWLRSDIPHLEIRGRE